MSIDFFHKFSSKIASTIRMGNKAPNPKPFFNDSPPLWSVNILIAIKLINHGPSVQPESPESANTLYIAPPDFGKSFAAKLKVAGHIILTLNPVNAHITKEITGLSIKNTNLKAEKETDKRVFIYKK